MDSCCISYKDTGFFSQTVIDYIDDVPALKPFYSHRPDIKGFGELLTHKKFVANRQVLHQVLTDQYKSISDVGFTISDLVSDNIDLLKADNTYTVTTGHQLNIFAGPLYFIYKIVTAIKLARELKANFPDKNFVPVYWMASEDHDFAEINYTNIGGKKVHWWYEATGATGRISPESIREAQNQYKGALGWDVHAADQPKIVETDNAGFEKLAVATP